jgi:DNA sulfur modification protein DndB
MAEPFPGLITGDDLKAEYAKRSKSVDEQTIKASTKNALEMKLEAELVEGWRVERESKRSIRLVRDKPVDRQLEDDVWALLYRMGFKELNADRHFAIPNVPRQLDIFAKDDETVFIVECTHSSDVGPKSLKTLLDKFGALRDDIIKAIHKHYGKEPRLKIKLGIATRNIEWRSVDRGRAEESGIAILTDVDLSYFNKLTSLLKSAARYQFLDRYLSGEKVEGLQFKLPATRGKSGGSVFYNFLISPHDLLRIAYINHKARTANDDIGTYQRMVKPTRLKSIGQYLDDGGKFPTNIVINFKVNSLRFDKQESFEDTSTGILHLPANYGSAWVIDGQHRLYGYVYSSRVKENDNSVVSVLAYEDLPIREEMELFVDINTRQVKVSRNLVNEILSGLNINDPDPRKRLDALHARIALRLDDYIGSPLKGRIVTVTQDKTPYRCVTQISLADQLRIESLIGEVYQPGKSGQPLLLAGPLADLSTEASATLERSVETLSRYLALFAKEIEDHWNLGDAKGGYLCTNNGIRALLVLLRRLLRFIESADHIRPNTLSPEELVDRLEPYLVPLIEFFKSADINQINAFRTGGGSSLASVTSNCFKMMSIINERKSKFMTPELENYINTQDFEGTKQARMLLSEIEEIIFEDVISKIKNKYGLDKEIWWISGVPKSVRNDADKMYNESQGDRERWRYLHLSSYPDILQYQDNWEMFKDFYNFHGKVKKSEQLRWMGRLVKARNIASHPPKGSLTKDEVEFVRKVHQLVKTHIEDEQAVDGKRSYLDDIQPKDRVDVAA